MIEASIRPTRLASLAVMQPIDYAATPFLSIGSALQIGHLLVGWHCASTVWGCTLTRLMRESGTATQKSAIQHHASMAAFKVPHGESFPRGQALHPTDAAERDIDP